LTVAFSNANMGKIYTKNNALTDTIFNRRNAEKADVEILKSLVAYIRDWKQMGDM